MDSQERKRMSEKEMEETGENRDEIGRREGYDGVNKSKRGKHSLLPHR